MSLLELTTDANGTIVSLALTGEFDIAGAAAVEHELQRIEEDSPATIALDLRGLSFMDSTALRIIIAADARAREQSRRLVLVRGPDPVHRILRMTRLDERLEIVDDPAALLPAA